MLACITIKESNGIEKEFQEEIKKIDENAEQNIYLNTILQNPKLEAELYLQQEHMLKLQTDLLVQQSACSILVSSLH